MVQGARGLIGGSEVDNYIVPASILAVYSSNLKAALDQVSILLLKKGTLAASAAALGSSSELNLPGGKFPALQRNGL